jgi:glycine C-acetyltransferase
MVFFVSGVAYPVVPKGVVLIRLIPMASHTDEHIEKTLNAFEAIKPIVFKNINEAVTA